MTRRLRWLLLASLLFNSVTVHFSLHYFFQTKCQLWSPKGDSHVR